VNFDVRQNMTLDDLNAGKVHILLASPESLLSKAGRKILKNIGPKMIKCLVIDEAHCIKK
jgi:superfamily II DNA helicase RecQ